MLKEFIQKVEAAEAHLKADIAAIIEKAHDELDKLLAHDKAEAQKVENKIETVTDTVNAGAAAVAQDATAAAEKIAQEVKT